jgi:DNA gyrase subunit A
MNLLKKQYIRTRIKYMENNDNLNDGNLPENNGGPGNNRGRIIPVNIEEQMKTSYIDYSMSVIVGRALPDVRDGLKPVHRRVLYGMSELGNASNKPYKKSARIVGEVMGKYHPHGDASIYDTMVRMAQDWSMRYTLIDGQGNFGSQDGDPPAAMRYTEARLTHSAMQLMDDLEKDTVDYVPNYDETKNEPTVFPSKFPNLLCNGSSGIAVGMATNIPPHNLNEIIKATLLILDDPLTGVDDIMKVMPGPDFPTGGIICGYRGIKEAFHTGRGKLTLRGVIVTEDINEGSDRQLRHQWPLCDGAAGRRRLRRSGLPAPRSPGSPARQPDRHDQGRRNR